MDDLSPFRPYGPWHTLSRELAAGASRRSIGFEEVLEDKLKSNTRLIALRSDTSFMTVIMMGTGKTIFAVIRGSSKASRSGHAEALNFDALPRILDRMLP